MNSFTVNSSTNYPRIILLLKVHKHRKYVRRNVSVWIQANTAVWHCRKGGYKYVPYQQSNDSTASVIISTELSWNASAGLYLPYLLCPRTNLISLRLSEAQPTLNLEDIMNRNMKGLPDSLLYSYNKNTQIKPLDTSMIDPSLISLLPGVYDSVRNDVSTIVDTTVIM